MRQQLISCIMPTRGRPELAPVAIRCFEAQDWTNKELVVIDDEDALVLDRARRFDPDLHVFLARCPSIGEANLVPANVARVRRQNRR